MGAVHFETISTFESLFLQPRAEALSMLVVPCGLDELGDDWEADGKSIRSKRGFYNVEGRCVKHAKGVRVNSWSAPMFVQPSGNVVMVKLKTARKSTRVLLRAIGEAGNLGYELPGNHGPVNSRVLVGPAIQFSPGNLNRHRGKIPLAELIIDPEGALLAPSEPAVEDGGRFYEKRNRYILLEGGRALEATVDTLLAKLEPPDRPENYCWVTISLLRAIRARGWTNGHLRSAMSLLV